MMKGIAQDFVRYVMHVQVVSNDQQQQAAPAPAAAPAAVAPADTLPSGLQNLQTTSSDDQDTSGFRTAAASAVASGEAPPEVLAPAASPTAIPQAPARARQAARQTARPAAKQETVVKDEWAKTSRNAPCPCGSGKKFKMCHGAG